MKPASFKKEINIIKEIPTTNGFITFLIDKCIYKQKSIKYKTTQQTAKNNLLL